MMDQEQQELHMVFLQWAQWHMSCRRWAPPVPQNILARMQPCKIREAPDTMLSADMSYLNLALLSQPESKGKKAIYHFYIHQLRPIKLVASEMEMTTQGFYKAKRKVMEDAYRAYKRMMRGEETKTVSDIPVSEMSA